MAEAKIWTVTARAQRMAVMQVAAKTKTEAIRKAQAGQILTERYVEQGRDTFRTSEGL